MRNRSPIDVTVTHNTTFTEVQITGQLEECRRWVAKALRADDYIITERPLGLECVYDPQGALKLRASDYPKRVAELRVMLPGLKMAYDNAPDMSHAKAVRGVKHPDEDAYLDALRSLNWLETELAKLNN